MKFDTKIAVVLRDDLPVWQQLNMTAFLVSGIAGTVQGVVGEDYVDGSGTVYLPMFRQPVLVFGVTGEQLRQTYTRALAHGVKFSVFTEDLFSTGHDEANREAVKARSGDDLPLTGMAFRADKKVADSIVKGLSLHK
jgi:hypothetical protein